MPDALIANPAHRPETASQPGPGAGRAQGGLWPLATILLVGLVLRLALWCWFDGQTIHIGDEKDYDAIAQNLVSNGVFGSRAGLPDSIRPPLYPALVAVVYLVAGIGNFQAVRLVQIFISLANTILMYFLGKEVFGQRGGLWLAAIFCLYPSLVVYDNLVLTEVLFTFLLCAFVYATVLALRRNSLAWAGGAGVLLGLAALARSVLWLFPPVLIVLFLVRWPGTWRRRLLGSGCTVAAFAITLAPWAIRNTRLEHTLITVDSMGGRNFMMGNYRYTPLYRSWDAIAIEGRRSWIHEVVTTSSPAEHDTQGKIDKLAMKRGLQFAMAHPTLTLGRDFIKFFDFWGLERELTAGAAEGFFGPVPRPWIWVLTAVINLAYVGVLFASIFGIFLNRAADKRVRDLLLLLILLICGIHTIVFGHSRYHLPLIPLLMVFTIAVFTQRDALQPAYRRLRLWGAGCLCALICLGWVWNVVAGDWERFRHLF